MSGDVCKRGARFAPLERGQIFLCVACSINISSLRDEAIALELVLRKPEADGAFQRKISTQDITWSVR
jgi:hypothetical protein